MTLTKALRSQAIACDLLGSPFMHRLCTLLADHWDESSELGQLCATWPGDIGPAGASLPLRIAGGLHALVLSQRDADLIAVYPPNTASDDALRHAVFGAFTRHRDHFAHWMQAAPQTNEVRRSAAILAAASLLSDHLNLPFVTSELGASAGLNMGWDRYALRLGDTQIGADSPALTLAPQWQGSPPPGAPIHVAERAGVDLNPIRAQEPDQGLRLLSYLWPDQPERFTLTRAAIATQNDHPDQGDAIDWLAQRLETQHPGHLHLIYHTVAWQYFPPEKQEQGTRLIETAGAQATPDTPLAWFAMEADGQRPGAALTLRLWPGDLKWQLGRADFHGRWIDWRLSNLT